jgi:hypothetical protein
MNLNFDFTGIEALSGSDGGKAPPAGAYKATITEATIEDSKNIAGLQNLIVSYNVVEGQYTGSGCRAWFPLPNGVDGGKDSFKLRKLKTLFLAIGAPANAMQGKFGITIDQLMGKVLVIFVTDKEASPEGRRRYDADPVLPENAASALAGEWTPYGGRTMQTTPSNGGNATMTTENTQQGGFNFGGFQANVP